MRSDNVTKGMQQAPHRSLFNALGMTKEELNKPLIGIVSSYNEIVPGHMNIDKIVDAAGAVLRRAHFDNLKNPFAKGSHILKHSCLSSLVPG